MKQDFGKKIGKTGKYWKFCPARSWPGSPNYSSNSVERVNRACVVF